jgi:hypothetical protein
MIQAGASLIPMPMAFAFAAAGHSGRDAPCARAAVVSGGAAAQPVEHGKPSPASTTHDCQICITLHSAGMFLPAGAIETLPHIGSRELAAPARSLGWSVTRPASSSQPRAPPPTA